MSADQGGTCIVVDGVLYYIAGKTRIKVTEHFPEDGATLPELMEDVLTYSARTAQTG